MTLTRHGQSVAPASSKRYSLLERPPERDLLRMARAFDLGVTCWSPLSGGLLTGKYLSDAAHSDAGRVVREVVALSDELGVTPSQVALAWLLGVEGT